MVGSFIAFVVSMIAYRNNFKEILNGILNEGEKNIITYFILIALPIFFLTVPFILFPLTLIQGGGFTDVFTHYFGLVYGFMISYQFFTYKK